ncbi:MAG TPA: SpoIIE family protein phosphatase [Thermoanaerobaculia bacterium]
MTEQSERRTARALYALLDLAKALSSEIDLDSLLKVIEEKASSVVEAERTNAFVLDSARGLPIGVAGEVARTRSVVNIVDAGSLLAVPIISSGGELLGVLQSMNKMTADRFDDDDESLMMAVASHVAVAIERARFTALSIENERLAAGLKLASEIQMRMLPSATVALSDDSPFEMHAYIRPAKMVGGDLYDFALKGNRLYFCIGDVSGKGIGSALVMALTKTLFRANAAYYADAAKLMEAVNVRLYEETGPTMFVTAFCGFLDLNDGMLRFSNAGHDRPFLLRRDGTVELLESKPGLALGVMPKFRYPLQDTTLARGDALFLYTDGVTEATNASEELFTMERLRDTLEGCAGDSVVRVLEKAIDAVDGFVEQAPQADDIAMMCIRYLGVRRRAAAFDRNLEELPRVMRLAERLDQAVRFPVELALEEIFTNIVKHNPAGKSNIGIDLDIIENEVVITITDFDTPRFDPIADAPEVDIGQTLENRTAGGLGIHLVKKMMDRIEYSHQNRTGTITLRKRMN